MPAVNPKALINQWIPGGYRIRRFIGAGAFAWVYEAATARGESVAVKMLQNATPEARTMFTREIKVLRQLPQNENCVRYVDDGVTDDGMIFLAMEYVDGCTLKDAFRFKPAWEIEEACHFMLQLCDALAGLHRLGVAHRDLKPENVMVTRDWRVKLMDFGLVKDAQGLLKLFETEDILTGKDFAENIDRAMLAGTPEYMAPEQFSDPMVDEELAKTDTWSDVYSLGLIFYQLLTGQKLFPLKAETRDQGAYARALLKYIKWRTSLTDSHLTRPSQIPPELWRIIAVTLRQNPKHRPRTAADLAAAIQRYLQEGESDEFDEAENTNMADMSSVLAALGAAQPARSKTPSVRPPSRRPAGHNKGEDDEDRTEWSAPVDVAAVQAYREQRLNHPPPDGTVPPGMYTADQVLAHANGRASAPSIAPPSPVAASAAVRKPAHTAPLPLVQPAGQPQAQAVPLVNHAPQPHAHAHAQPAAPAQAPPHAQPYPHAHLLNAHPPSQPVASVAAPAPAKRSPWVLITVLLFALVAAGVGAIVMLSLARR